MLFTNTCAKCHTLFAQGGQIGPDLTAYKRDDLANMLAHIVNPSVEIREGFENHVLITDDGLSEQHAHRLEAAGVKQVVRT